VAAGNASCWVSADEHDAARPDREQLIKMNAQQRAARVAAEIERSRAIADTVRGVTLIELGVRVKGHEVRKNGLTWGSSLLLGSLAGACAGVMDLKSPSAGAMLSSAPSTTALSGC
jgi:hypothetical protein